MSAIAASAGETERAHRLPGPLLDLLLQARLFRLLMPGSVDGDQVEPLAFLRVLEQVAGADASTAWCLAQTSVCSMAASRLDLATAHELFGGPRAILAWGDGVPGRAVPCAGGWCITGAWSFGSGSHHATWLGGTCALDGSAATRVMLFPQAQARFTEDWQVIGLRGTGSDSYRVAELFVPAACSFQFSDPAQPHAPAALYLMPFDSLWAGGFASVALGVAQAMLAALIVLAQQKTPRALPHTLAEVPATQALVGEADAALRAARCFLHDAVGTGWRQVVASGAIDLDHRMTIRQAASHAIGAARSVSERVFHAAGSSAVFAGGPFERRVRDMHMITQHVHGRQQHFEVVGQFMLGLVPKTAFF